MHDAIRAYIAGFLDGDGSIIFQLVRRHFRSPSVHSRMIGDRVGYLRLTSFSHGAGCACKLSPARRTDRHLCVPESK